MNVLREEQNKLVVTAWLKARLPNIIETKTCFETWGSCVHCPENIFLKFLWVLKANSYVCGQSSKPFLVRTWEKWHNLQFPLLKLHVADWVANWLGWDVSGGIRGGLPPSFSYSSIPLSLRLSVHRLIICCEGAAHDEHASGWIRPLYHWEWMNDLAVTRPREENTCSAGFGWLATCREGWEFLQQERWWDGGMEEGGARTCLPCPDIFSDRILACWLFWCWKG